MANTSQESTTLEPAEQFESMEVQAHAAKLGMWIFLSSEILLFAGLFTLFAAARARDPVGFHDAVLHNTKTLGSINTAILLLSSTTAAAAVHQIRADKRAQALWLFCATMVLGLVFLGVKFTEYAQHFREGIYPGGQGSYFTENAAFTHAPFWTLYYVMTGLHAIHVTVGITLLGTVVWGIRNRAILPGKTQRAEIGAMYWHLIDLIWIFLWPLLYLT